MSTIWALKLILVSEAVTSRDQEGFSGGWHPNLAVNRGNDLLYKSRFMGKMKAHSLSKYGAKCEYNFFDSDPIAFT